MVLCALPTSAWVNAYAVPLTGMRRDDDQEQLICVRCLIESSAQCSRMASHQGIALSPPAKLLQAAAVTISRPADGSGQSS
ncbi:hypothetical protein CG740_39145 [Streptomyces sp. CB01201]|nr:hypothetical protein CG740_39145 [Streptomyces sp. CB01201]